MCKKEVRTHISWTDFYLNIPNVLSLWVLYLGSVEDVLNRQHRNNGQHLFTAAQVDGHDQHLTQHGLQRKLCHLEERQYGANV